MSIASSGLEAGLAPSDLTYYDYPDAIWLRLMKIVWDEPKRLTNLKSRRLDFAHLDTGFFVDATVSPAKAGRLKAIGQFNGAILTVIFKPLGSEAISVVSMRHASRKERKTHEQS